MHIFTEISKWWQLNKPGPNPRAIEDGAGRRKFLKDIAGAGAVLASTIAVPDIVRSVVRDPSLTAEAQDEVDPIVTEIESLSEQELQRMLMQDYPVLPNPWDNPDQFSGIDQIFSKETIATYDSPLGKAGSSVGRQFGMSWFGGTVSLPSSDGESGNWIGFMKSDGMHAESWNLATQNAYTMFIALKDSEWCRLSFSNDAVQDYFISERNCIPGSGAIPSMFAEHKPKIIMNFFGTDEATAINLDTNPTHDFYDLPHFISQLRTLLQYYIDQSVVPVFTTFPLPWEENHPWIAIRQTNWTAEDELKIKKWQRHRALQYNVAICKVCKEMGFPVVNLLRDVREALPDFGNGTTIEDPWHFSYTTKTDPVTGLNLPLTDAQTITQYGLARAEETMLKFFVNMPGLQYMA